MKKRERPTMTENDAKRFALNAELNQKKLELKNLRIKAQPLNTAIYLLECEVFGLEEDLSELD